MNKSDYHLFQVAREESLRADYSGTTAVKIGCVAVYKGTVLAKGCNSDRTHTLQKQFNQYRFKDDGSKYLPSKKHSEIACLSKIKYLDIDFSKVKIYVYREFKDGRTANSRPCPACMAMIHSYGIRTILYTTTDGYCEEVLR